MPENINALCWINEQTADPSDQVNFGYTVCRNDNRFYLKFPATLQSFGIRNRNQRYYEAANIWDCIQSSDYIQDMLRRNSWLGELDHPAEEIMGQKLTVQRIGNPDPKHTSHYIRKPHLEGNLLKANIQTDSGTEEGRNLAIKIVDGKIIPGFSARVLGELQNRNGNPTVFVRKLITYDAVLYPSHPTALGEIHQPLAEATEEVQQYTGKIIYFQELAQMAANSSKETEWLCESFGLNIDDVIGLANQGQAVVIQEKQNLYAQPITDKIIRQRTVKSLRNFLQ